MCVILFILLLLCKTAHPSNICIFVDHQPDKNHSIYTALKKTIHTNADHIFVTPPLWNFFSKYQAAKQRKKLRAQWQFYDTHIGLIYIKSKRISKKNGINTKELKRLKKPFNKKIQEESWISLFPSLFNIKLWQKHHQKTTQPSIVYMDGHGSKRRKDPSAEKICGILAYEFANLLNFFYTTLHIDLLGVQTCHWTSMRILELIAKKHKYTSSPFGIITPLRTEEVLTTASSNLNKKKTEEYCFLKALQLIMNNYNGTITPKMKDIACRIDTLKHPKNNKQGITFIPSGDIFAHVL